ncbi:hypothetical protein [Desulforhabdus amnigena]|uniref:Uncharacterized protein n=1 Tax=Desulforhabdus amnigena TaxID=40218 RepID=A0A9W6D2R6_9BACT|nr:hypothetical protein [Desulforhabdus amnigena]NLJ29634.1 hypothetical protein [Deltaproteobacteria bacterium]GLI33849.1 hypothetical protein DAMNIGENAA_12820 [Desulforhabdus amnigena]
MAKKKTKKLERDLEKFLRTGNYWKWLHEVEASNLEAQYAEDLSDVWKSLIRRALRDPHAFKTFCEEVQSIRNLPASADFTFLMVLEGFLEGTKTRQDLADLKGLSLPAETLRERALLWNDEIFSSGRMQKLLKPFAVQPEKVTQRYYDELSRALIETELAVPVEMLGEHIPELRRMNSKAGVAKGWKAVDFEELANLEDSLSNIMENFPPSLFQLLVHPFAFQIAALMKRLGGKGDPSSMAGLVSAIPTLFQSVAGENADEIRAQLLRAHPESMSAAEIPRLESQIATGSFEEKLVLLNRMREMLKQKSHKDEEEFLPFSLFGEEEEVDEESWRVFRLLFNEILREIGERTKDISPREGKELRQVMDRIIQDNFPLLIDDPGDAKELAPLLSRLVEAHCLGKRLALLALIVAKGARNVSLQHAAESVLDQSAPVDIGDMEWLLTVFRPLYYPGLRILTPLLDRFPSDSEIYPMIPMKILHDTEDLVALRTLTGLSHGLMAGFTKGLEKKFAQEFNKLRQELKELGDYQQLNLLRKYIECFPEGIHTPEALNNWLENLRNFYPGNFLSALRKELEGLAVKKASAEDMFFLDDSVTQFLDGQISTIFNFLKKHEDDLLTAEPGDLQGLFDVMKKFRSLLRRDPSPLVRVGNMLQRRIESGDMDVAPVRDQFMRLLSEVAKPPAKSSRRKRGRK